MDTKIAISRGNRSERSSTTMNGGFRSLTLLRRLRIVLIQNNISKRFGREIQSSILTGVQFVPPLKFWRLMEK